MKKKIAIVLAFLAALLYSLSIPLSKILLNKVSPTIMASALYLGAGIGIGIVYLTNKYKTKSCEYSEYEQINKKDLMYIIGMIVLDIFAPILLMLGLKYLPSSSVALINNFEIVCTSLVALFIFKESISKKMWIGITIITISIFFLSIDNLKTFTFS